jgi:hypothetical protein
MPPSGGKPTGGAVDIYGVHEFHDPPPRFALKMRLYRLLRGNWLPQGEIFSCHPDKCGGSATI